MSRSRRFSGAGRLAAALVATILLAGCSGGSADSMTAGGNASGTDAGGVSRDTSEADRAAAKEVADTAPLPQHVIRTARVEIEDDDLHAVRREVDSLLERLGGHVAEEETVNDESGRPGHSRLVLRVPSRAFEQVLTSFEDFTTVLSTERDGEDVGSEVVDLDARIRAQEVSLRRLRGFLGQAENIDSLVRVEGEITRREADLQALRARAEHLADQVALSTITVRMTSPDAPVTTTGSLDDAGFLAGLKAGWHALGAVVIVAVTALGAALPFLLLVAALAIPLLAVRRRRSTRPTEGEADLAERSRGTSRVAK